MTSGCRWGIGLAFVVASPVLAQQVGDSRLTGRVVDPKGAGVAGAEVLAQAVDIRVTTDSLGRFVLVGLAPGRISVLIRRPGFAPRKIAIEVSAGVAVINPIVLQSTAVQLPELRAQAESDRRLGDFQRRRRSGFGTFLGPDEVAAKNAMHTVELLQGIPGVKVSLGPPGVNDLNYVIFSRCRESVSVWIDGVQLRVGAGKPTPVDVAEMLSRISPSEIAAIEIFRGPAELPAEFNNDSCAAVSIWTK